jgi:hypothetical protein
MTPHICEFQMPGERCVEITVLEQEKHEGFALDDRQRQCTILANKRRRPLPPGSDIHSASLRLPR